jgi:hypothetical protein
VTRPGASHEGVDVLLISAARERFASFLAERRQQVNVRPLRASVWKPPLGRPEA